MSDEFIRIATQEIKDEISEINKILESCTNDSDITKNAEFIEKHVHKIKGLAPMMGQKGIGEIASLNDELLKYIIDGNLLEDFLDIVSESTTFMKNAMEGSDTNANALKQKIEAKYSKILD